MFTELESGLKTLALAGLGAAALACEKAGEVTEILAKKGDEVLQASKAANEELKHRAEKKPADADSLAEEASKLTPEERKELIARLQQLDQDGSPED